MEKVKKHQNGKNHSCLSDGISSVGEEPIDLEGSSLSFKLQDIKKNATFKKERGNSFNNEADNQTSSGYSTIKDNSFFSKFANQYNKKLIAAFEEADKATNTARLNTSTATLKQDVLAYMEQHSEIRKLMKAEVIKANANPPLSYHGNNTP